MAYKHFFNQTFTFLALVLIITLSLSACSSPTDQVLTTDPLTETYTTVKGTKTYELTITQSAANANAKSAARAAFIPAAGDTYVLKIAENGVTQISSGTVKAYSNNKFTLVSSINVTVSFEVTISGSSINNITGTITVETGVTIIGPGTITPVTGFVAVTGITGVPTSGTVGTLTHMRYYRQHEPLLTPHRPLLFRCALLHRGEKRPLFTKVSQSAAINNFP